MAELRNATGRAIRFARERARLTQEQLAERAGVSKTQLGHVERGDAGLTVDFLSRVATGLGLSLSQLTEEIESERRRDQGR